jgi:hypothetical protein
MHFDDDSGDDNITTRDKDNGGDDAGERDDDGPSSGEMVMDPVFAAGDS